MAISAVRSPIGTLLRAGTARGLPLTPFRAETGSGVTAFGIASSGFTCRQALLQSPAVPTLWIYPLLFLTALIAGFIDSIAGGGGLITIPVLLNLGLPPQLAIGTNKLQATFGSSSAMWHYGRAGLIDYWNCRLGILCTFIGAMLGAWFLIAVSRSKPETLRQIIPCLLIAIALYMLFQPKLGETDRRPRMNAGLFHVGLGLLIGFYDGFFGPGTGTFWAMAYMLGLGFNMTKATAHTKVMNCASNIGALLVFIAGGQVQFGAGLCMSAGQLLGARLGAKVVIRRGTKFIRPVFIVVVLAVTARLLWQNFVAR
jgi:hypothetical protein